MEFIMLKEGNKLICLDIYLEDFCKLPNGLYEVKLKRQRNIKHHKKFFAILTIAYENLEGYADKTQLLDEIKLALNYFDIIRINDKDVIKLKSISFDNMDEVEFTNFYDKALQYLADKLKVEKWELENAADDYL